MQSFTKFRRCEKSLLCVNLMALTGAFDHPHQQMVVAQLSWRLEIHTKVTTETTPTQILNRLPKRASQPALRSDRSWLVFWNKKTDKCLGLAWRLLRAEKKTNKQNKTLFWRWVRHPWSRTGWNLFWQPLQTLFVFTSFTFISCLQSTLIHALKLHHPSSCSAAECVLTLLREAVFPSQSAAVFPFHIVACR